MAVQTALCLVTILRAAFTLSNQGSYLILSALPLSPAQKGRRLQLPHGATAGCFSLHTLERRRPNTHPRPFPVSFPTLQPCAFPDHSVTRPSSSVLPFVRCVRLAIVSIQPLQTWLDLRRLVRLQLHHLRILTCIVINTTSVSSALASPACVVVARLLHSSRQSVALASG